jgi:catechol 2,3-dioxygenase-like lactoylglutathione lyase family enzyme
MRIDSEAGVAGLNHVGITVPDLDAAVRWYVAVLDLELLDGPMTCSTSTVGAERRAQVFGERWGEMKLAHLITANDAGIELFEFVRPATRVPDERFAYWEAGPQHVAFTVDDLDLSLARLLALGGRQRTDVFDVHDGQRVCYCEDPWGTIVELVGTGYRDLSAATAQP